MSNRPLRLSAGFMKLMKSHPYLTSAVTAMIPVEAPQVDTMSVDQYGRLYFNPQWIESISVDELATVIYHEVWHLLRLHWKRMKNYPQAVANLAGDMEINDDIRAEGMKLPGRPVYPENFGMEPHQTAEYYVGKLMENYEVEYSFGSERKETGGNGSQSDSSNSESGSGSDTETDTGQSTSQASNSPSGGSSGGSSGSSSGQSLGSSPAKSRRIQIEVRGFGGDCGSGATGRPSVWEQAAGNSAPHLSEAELEIIRRQVAEEIRRYASSSKSIGNIPGHWQRWADEILSPPKIPWQVKLRNIVRSAFSSAAGRVDYSFRRPSRRQASVQGVILPGMEEPVIRPAVVIDTSGSVSDNELKLALSELKGILLSTSGRTSVKVYAVDTQVQATGEVFHVQQVRKLLKGGGGTDMAEGIRQAAMDVPPPDVIIVITDAYTDWPDKSPTHIPIVVCLLPESGSDIPNWASVVKIESEVTTQ